MASVLLFLLPMLAVVAAASGYGDEHPQPEPEPELKSQYPSTPSGGQKELGLDKMRGLCKGAKELLLKRRDDCCDELGKHGQCICPTVYALIDRGVPLQHLCNSYTACKDSKSYSGNTGTTVPEAMVQKNQCTWPGVRSVKDSCNALMVLPAQQQHAGCFCYLAGLGQTDGSYGSSLFGKALAALGILEYAGVIRSIGKQCPPLK